MKRLIKYIFAAVLLSLAFLGVAVFFSTRKSQTYTSPLTPVSVIKGEERVISDSYTISGYVEAEAMIPVVPFVQGTITEFYAENGMDVIEGQVLAVIDTEPYELQKKQAEAAYLAYEATFERVSALYEKGSATRQNYDEVKAQRDASKAQYDLACLQLGYCYVDSPVDGTILMSSGSVGSIGTSQSPIAVVADLSSLIVNVSIPEKYFMDIDGNKDKLRVEVLRRVDGKEYRTDAEVVSISPYIDPTTKKFNLKVRLTGDVSSFRPGMMVEVKVIYRQEKVLSLPQSIKKLDGTVYSVMEGEDGSWKAKFLSLPSLLSDDDYFQIEEIYRDTLFVSRGQTKILDGQKVELVKGF